MGSTPPRQQPPNGSEARSPREGLQRPPRRRHEFRAGPFRPESAVSASIHGGELVLAERLGQARQIGLDALFLRISPG